MEVIIEFVTNERIRTIVELAIEISSQTTHLFTTEELQEEQELKGFSKSMAEAGVTNFENVEVEAAFTPEKWECKTITGQLFSKQVTMEFFEKWEMV